MAKYFLGSVGKAEAFRMGADNKLELAFVSKTLTDSGLNISTTKDDIRAGQGAPIQFSFYHDPSVEITLTDVLWKPEYLEAQLGAKFDEADHKDFKTMEVEVPSSGSFETKETILSLPLQCAGEEQYLLWAAIQGSDEWRSDITCVKGEGKFTLTFPDDMKGKKVCLRYLGHDARAKAAEITSQIIPQELYLVITAPIFAGDACAASKGKAAGHITFEVPRFQLNGAQEFSMNMSSNQTMSLAGIALASESAECDAVGGKLLRIIEVIEKRDWKEDIQSLASDTEYDKVGQIPHIYGVAKDAHLVKIDNDELTFNPVLANGKYTTQGSCTVTLKDTTISANITVAAE